MDPSIRVVPDLRLRVGDLSQMAAVREVRLADGNEDGVRALDIRVAGGIHALVLADRGMDLGPCWYAGQPLSWQSTTGIVHPTYFRDDLWLRSFHGGLLVTCGLQNVGSSNEDDGVRYGLHGRVSNIPARGVTHRVIEIDGRLVAEVSGEVRETDVYGADLVLRRRLRFPVGEPTIEIADEVENRGFTPAGLMILYHVNVGYPVVADTSTLLGPAATVVGWDDRSQSVVGDHATYGPPTPGFPALVYEHRLVAQGATPATIAVANPEYGPTGGIALSLTYDPRQLPRLWQWRMLAPGMYLTGLEPANCGVFGRAQERAAGTLSELAPGARQSFDLEIRATVGGAVANLIREHSVAPRMGSEH